MINYIKLLVLLSFVKLCFACPIIIELWNLEYVRRLDS